MELERTVKGMSAQEFRRFITPTITGSRTRYGHGETTWRVSLTWLWTLIKVEVTR